MSHLRLPGLCLLLLLLAGACGGDDAACRIRSNGDGTRTITCPGAPPVRVVDGDEDAICTIGSDPEGSLEECPDGKPKAISCSDGTFVRIDACGRVIFPGTGTIVGLARRWGSDDHAGIRVRIEGRDVATSTAADGSYELGPLPAGMYVVIFEAGGRMPHRIENVPVLTGRYELPLVELRHGRRVGPFDVDLDSAPTGDAVLVYRQVAPADGGWLDLVELPSGESRQLGDLVSGQFAFSPDGRWVLYRDIDGLAGRLRLWDRQEGIEIAVAEQVDRAAFLPNGTRVVFQVVTETGRCRLQSFAFEDRSTRTIGDCRYPATVFPEEIWRFSDDGGQLLYAGFGPGGNVGAIRVHDFATGADHLVELATSAVFSAFVPGSGDVLYGSGTASNFDLWHLDVATGSRRQIVVRATGTVWISPRGDAVVVACMVDDVRTLFLIRLGDGAQTTLDQGDLPWSVHWAEDGQHLAWNGFPQRAGLVPVDDPAAAVRLEGRFAIHGIFGDRLLVQDQNAVRVLLLGIGSDPVSIPFDTRTIVPSPDGTRVALVNESEIRLLEIADGSVRRLANPSAFLPWVYWMPDGSALVVAYPGDEGRTLSLWAPGEEPIPLTDDGPRSSSDVAATSGGTILYAACEVPCTSGWDLFAYDVTRRTRERMHADVASVTWKDGLAIYRVAASREEHLNGTWVASVP